MKLTREQLEDIWSRTTDLPAGKDDTGKEQGGPLAEHIITEALEGGGSDHGEPVDAKSAAGALFRLADDIEQTAEAICNTIADAAQVLGPLRRERPE